MNRRSFIQLSALAAVASPTLSAQTNRKHRVAVIGHTGRGNYGHSLDTVWQKIPETQVVAVADANEEGLEKAKVRLKTPQGFADYRAMLAAVKPDFVSVCPRHADQHRDMALAAIEAGVKGLYVEKPFCRTPAEADSLVAACDAHGAKIAVAHRNRYHPALQVIDQWIEDGKLGKLLQIRGRGKGDRRGGDEDLWVLGSHVMNLICYFGGRPLSCYSVMLLDGERVTKAHIREGAEGLGPLAANQLHARYEMSSGVIASYDSMVNDETNGAGFGLQLVGSAGLINIQIDRRPVAHFVPGNPFQPTEKARPWIPIHTTGVGAAQDDERILDQVANHVIPVRDLIDSVVHDRKPLCDVRDGRDTVEMICGVFESHRQGGRAVSLPLEDREHPLMKL